MVIIILNNNRSESFTTESVKNIFTAYLKIAIHRKRRDYLKKRIRLYKRESSISSFPYFPLSPHEKVCQSIDINSFLIRTALNEALEHIHQRDRYLFLARILSERSFRSLGSEVGLTSQGASAAYNKTIKTLRKIMERSDL